jgi:hypothetical protein
VPIQFFNLTNQPEAFSEASKERIFLFTPILFNSQHFFKISKLYLQKWNSWVTLFHLSRTDFIAAHHAVFQGNGIFKYTLLIWGLFLSESFIVAFLLTVNAATVRLAI